MGALSRWRKPQTETGERHAPRSVLAAAMPLVGPDVQTVNRGRGHSTTSAWQNQAWYFYDVTGELRGPVTWIANAVSKADLFAAEVDTATGTVTGPTDDARVQAVAAMALGGMSRRAAIQKLIAIQWQVAGESFIIIRPGPVVRGVQQPDRWLALSGNKVAAKGEKWTFTDPETMMPVTLGSKDRLLRVWDAHPDDQAKADSAVRPALVPLAEIEKASQNIASRLDSRLAGNGLLLLPQEMDFPTGDADTSAEAFMDVLYTAMEAALKNPGQSSAQVPLVATMPGEFIGQVTHLDLSTVLDAAVSDLRRDALSRLAGALDMPKSVAEGTQGEANHWSAWQVEESTYKIFIEPLLDRIGDALTELWFHPTLAAMGVSDPGRYVLAWETSGIVSRPDRTAELVDLWDKGLISSTYLLAEMGIPDDAVPSEGEALRRLAERLVTTAPTTLENGSVAELLGLDVSQPQEPFGGGNEGAPAIEPPSAPERTTPDTQDSVPEGLVAAAELLVFDALSRAGGRLLTREYRHQFASTPKHELHTVIPVDQNKVDALMEGSFQFADGVADQFGIDRTRFRSQVEECVTTCLMTRGAYKRSTLANFLSWTP